MSQRQRQSPRKMKQQVVIPALPLQKLQSSGDDNERFEVFSNNYMADTEKSNQDWHTIKNKIDKEYQKKMKVVSDAAIVQLKTLHTENKVILKKSQNIIDYQEVKQSQRLLSPKRSPIRMMKPKDKSVISLSTMTAEQEYNAKKIRELHQRYKEILMRGKNMVGEIYLVDVLSLLDLVDQNEDMLYFLERSQHNIVVQSNEEEYQGQQDIMVKNLFKIICGILKLSIDHMGTLDDQVLETQLDCINHTRDDIDTILINQMAILKNLICRPSFSLNDEQIRRIHFKFRNMSDQKKIKERIASQMIEEQEQIEQMQEKKQFFTPQFKNKSTTPVQLQTQPVQQFRTHQKMPQLQHAVARSPERASAKNRQSFSPSKPKSQQVNGQNYHSPQNPQSLGQKLRLSQRQKSWDISPIRPVNVNRTKMARPVAQSPEFKSVNKKYVGDSRGQSTRSRVGQHAYGSPIFLLKIELEEGNTQYIEILQGQNPTIVVQEFGSKWNLTDNAKSRLLRQVHQQLNEE